MPLSPTSTRELLQQLEHFPNKKLGQNFLVDGNIVRKSIELAEIGSGSAVVEIGPGLGTLTRAILSTGADVWAVERDATFGRAYPNSAFARITAPWRAYSCDTKRASASAISTSSRSAQADTPPFKAPQRGVSACGRPSLIKPTPTDRRRLPRPPARWASCRTRQRRL